MSDLVQTEQEPTKPDNSIDDELGPLEEPAGDWFVNRCEVVMYHLTIHPTASEFLAQTEAILAQDEVTNALMLGLATRLRQHPEQATPDLLWATIHENGQLIASALRTPPRNLLVHSNVADPASAFALLAQHLLTQGIAPPGVNGRTAWSQAFAEEWQRLSGQPCQVAMQLRVFKLTEVVYGLRAAQGVMRHATVDDVALVHAWSLAFAQEAMPHLPLRTEPVDTEWSILQGNIFLWEREGAVVSMAAKTRETANGITIGPVYTPPASRGHGYATALVAHLSQHLLDSGKQFVTLFTDLANPTSNKIYQRIGYQAVCDFTEYRFG